MHKILVIEDEKNLRETLEDLLEFAGYDVSTANNGKEGFEAILAQQPDLVICDVNMPTLGGFELLGAINQRMSDDVIPVFLFLTAMVDPEQVRHGMNLGADDYILKPFDQTEMLRIIQMRLEKRKKLTDVQKSNTKQKIAESNDKLAIPCEDGLELVPYDEILRCQAERAYCTFYLKEGKSILVSKPLREFEDALLARNFFKVHKSTIINVKYAKKYVRGKGGCVIMTDGSLVNVAPARKEELLLILKP